MPRPSRLVTSALLPVLVAAGLAAPGAALGKGGGSSTPPPPPASTVYCDYALDGPTADGGNVFSNQAGDAGCISVIQRDSTLRLYSVALTPGWTYTVKKNGEGTDSTVLVIFNNAATGGKVEALIEFGKTWIR
ncbi:MAG: hypothetical protein QOJ89_2569 [bacterium]|jgi:hypothetical protein